MTKISLLAAALVALTLTACDRPKQASPEGADTYGTRLEEGTTLSEERGAGYEPPVAGADDEDEFSGRAVLPGHALDANGNPLRPGHDGIPKEHMPGHEK